LQQRLISGPEREPKRADCILDLFRFARIEGRAVVAAFDGGKITSDASLLSLGPTDRAIWIGRSA